MNELYVLIEQVSYERNGEPLLTFTDFKTAEEYFNNLPRTWGRISILYSVPVFPNNGESKEILTQKWID